MKNTFRFLIAVSLTLAFSFPVLAQVASGRPTNAAPTYNEGVAAPLSLDLSGNLRVTGSPSGTQNVNLTEILGAAPSLSNPLWIMPGTGASFAVTGTFWQATQPVSVATLPALPANQSTNIAQINGITPLMGNGATGTGSPRVTIASDNSAIPAAGQGAIASAVPAGATYVGANSGGNLTGLIQASASAAINVSTATTTELVAISGSTKIYVTSFDVIAGGTGNITIVYGTGSACGTGTTSLTGAYNLTAQAGIAKGNGLGPVLVVPAGNALCVTTSAAVQMSGSVSYTQF